MALKTPITFTNFTRKYNKPTYLLKKSDGCTCHFFYLVLFNNLSLKRYLLYPVIYYIT